MRVKELFDGRYQIVAVMEGGVCPALDFLTGAQGDNYAASRNGLLSMLAMLAQEGFDGVPRAWTHEADKQRKIYEFIKGDLRLFFFKGAGRQISVCTVGVVKKGQKADKRAVQKSSEMREDYMQAVSHHSLIIEVEEDDENNQVY